MDDVATTPVTKDPEIPPGTPEDVAILYSWANVQGAKYRDFSASRREYRAQQRAKVAEEQRQIELAAVSAKDAAIQHEVAEAQRLVQQAPPLEKNARAKQQAEEALQRAEQFAQRERSEIQRHEQSAERFRMRAERARNEMFAARRRSEEQALYYAEGADSAEREHDPGKVPGEIADPYYYSGPPDPATIVPSSGMRSTQITRISSERKPKPNIASQPKERVGRLSHSRAKQEYRGREGALDVTPVADGSQQEQTRPVRESSPDDREETSEGGFGEPHTFRTMAHRQTAEEFDVQRSGDTSVDVFARTVRQPRPSFQMQEQSDTYPVEREEALDTSNVPPAWLTSGEQTAYFGTSQQVEPRDEFASQEKTEKEVSAKPHAPDQGSKNRAKYERRDSNPRYTENRVPVRNLERRISTASQMPRWNFAEQLPNVERPAPAGFGLSPFPGRISVSDTLQQSRERVASRWFALQGILGEGSAEPVLHTSHTSEMHAPVLSVLALSGGVGKTSIVATLGRALSSQGEKVLLADVNQYGLLPFYFGARELRPGAARTFTAPPGSSDAPVSMMNYEVEMVGGDEAAQHRLMDDVTQRAEVVQRVLLDLNAGSTWLARRLAPRNPWILVPVVPDMNAVMATQATERLFAEIADVDGRPVRPWYVLNQYDSALPLHLDIREVLRQFLGERLLPFMIHRSPAVSEALAEGMTVIDYAPGSSIVEDYMNLASWVRGLASPGFTEPRGARWSER